MTENWYLVRTKPRQENLAKENLERQSYVVYLPRLMVQKNKRGKWIDVIEPLFPGYLFVSVDSSIRSLAPVRSTLGVAKIVQFGDYVRPVPDTIVSLLKSTEDAIDHLHRFSGPTLELGDDVEVIDGPFTGLDAVFQEQKGKDRALILVSVLGRVNQIEISANSISGMV
jgi:transcriptional antiterminator RfaH